MTVKYSFNTLSSLESETIHLARLTSQIPPDIEPVLVGDSQRVLNESDLADLQEKLETIKDHYPEINTKQSGGKFDVEIIPIIHNSFKKYDIEIITNAGFWRWLSTYAYDGWFYELIEWRYKFSDDTIVDQINWGIGNDNLIIEFYFYRNWLRGEIGYDEDRKNRYELAQLGDIDFWRSHILRQEYGRDRNFVKALLIILFHEKKYSFSIKTIRQELVPQIRSWYATGSFTHLNHNDCYEVVCEICDSIS